MNRQLMIQSPGELDSIFFQLIKRQAPQANQVEVEVFVAALNFKDILSALDLTETIDSKPILGWEVVGRIKQLGENICHLHIDDWVIVYSPNIFSDYITVDVDCVIKKPNGLSCQQAATLCVSYVTAQSMLLNQASITEKSNILIHSASGGVGLACIQVAMLYTNNIYATAGSQEKRDYLTNLGVISVGNSRDTSFVEVFKQKLGGNGFDIIVSAQQDELFQKNLSLLNAYGNYFDLGKSNKTLSILNTGAAYHLVGINPKMPNFNQLLNNTFDAVNQQIYQPLPYVIFDKTNIVEAFRCMSKAKHIGKILIQWQTNIPTDNNLNSIDTLDYSLSNNEGIKVFQSCLERAFPHSVISKQPNFDEASFSLEKMALRSLKGKEKQFDFTVSKTSTVEDKIKIIWMTIFSLDDIKGDDDFFALDGDSLIAIEISYKVTKSTGIDVGPHILLEHSVFKNFCLAVKNLK